MVVAVVPQAVVALRRLVQAVPWLVAVAHTANRLLAVVPRLVEVGLSRPSTVEEVLLRVAEATPLLPSIA